MIVRVSHMRVVLTGVHTYRTMSRSACQYILSIQHDLEIASRMHRSEEDANIDRYCIEIASNEKCNLDANAHHACAIYIEILTINECNLDYWETIDCTEISLLSYDNLDAK